MSWTFVSWKISAVLRGLLYRLTAFLLPVSIAAAAVYLFPRPSVSQAICSFMAPAVVYGLVAAVHQRQSVAWKGAVAGCVVAMGYGLLARFIMLGWARSAFTEFLMAICAGMALSIHFAIAVAINWFPTEEPFVPRSKRNQKPVLDKPPQTQPLAPKSETGSNEKAKFFTQ